MSTVLTPFLQIYDIFLKIVAAPVVRFYFRSQHAYFEFVLFFGKDSPFVKQFYRFKLLGL